MSTEYHLVDEGGSPCPNDAHPDPSHRFHPQSRSQTDGDTNINAYPGVGRRASVDEGCGGGVADDNLDCLLVPLSTTCGPEHVTDANSVVHPRQPGKEYQGPVRTLLFHDNQLQAHD